MKFCELASFSYLIVDREGSVKNYDQEFNDNLEKDGSISFDKAIKYVADNKNVLLWSNIHGCDNDFVNVTLPGDFTNKQKRRVNDLLVSFCDIYLFASVAYYSSLTEKSPSYRFISTSGYYHDTVGKIREFMYVSDLNHGHSYVKK